MKGRGYKLIALLLAGLLFVNGVPMENLAAESVSGSDGAELDYVLGRPMTEEEIRAQKEITREAMAQNGYIASKRDFDSLRLKPDIKIYKGTLPAQYDSRNVNGTSYVTAVKNQNPYGTCWSFAAAACAESDLISGGYCDNSIDLSESHLIFFSHHSAPDVLGNDYKDRVSFDHYASYVSYGGNEDLAYGTWATWKGAVPEENAPYDEVEEELEATTEVAYLQDVAHLQGFYRIHKADVDVIKATIMEHGAVGASYYESDIYRNYDTAAYYCNTETYSNHAITVVGWDDNYSKANFATTPSADGAWLIKNSWGDYWGLDGYFWMSYEDMSLDAFYFIDMESADNYDNNYQYDFCSTIIGQSARGSKAASVYEVKGNPNKQEKLEAVAINLMSETNVGYSIQIYKNPTDLSNPTSGTPLLSEEQRGTTTLAGYYTIPIEEDVVLNQGELFSVVFSFDEGTYVEAEISYDEVFINEASSREHESYIYNGQWIDLGAAGCGNLRIKAFTENLESANEQEYTITYQLNGGVNGAGNPDVYTASSETIVLTEPVRKGYTFAGWYKEATFVNKIAEIPTGSTGNLSLYAKWIANQYTISFAANGGSGTMSAMSGKQYGSAYALSANTFTRTGYTFNGWNTKKDGSGTAYKNRVTVKNLTATDGGKVTLYAQWSANKYTIKFNKNGGTGTTKAVSATYGKNAKLTKNGFKREGYTFKGWNTKKNGKGTPYKNNAKAKNLTVKNKGTVVLYAQWKAKDYKITYYLNGGKNHAKNPKKYTVATKTFTLKKPTKKGYRFEGWYSNKKLTKKVTQIKKGSTGNLKLYAKWVKK